MAAVVNNLLVTLDDAQGDGSEITVEPGLIGGEVNRILAAHAKKGKHPIQVCGGAVCLFASQQCQLPLSGNLLASCSVARPFCQQKGSQDWPAH